MLTAKAIKGETRSINVLVNWIVKLIPIVEEEMKKTQLDAEDQKILLEALQRLVPKRSKPLNGRRS